jgi:hypothetical protein
MVYPIRFLAYLSSKIVFGSLFRLLNHNATILLISIPKYIFADIHVEDSHITLNVCLGKQFTHGQMLFVGSRCGTHVNSESQPQVLYLHNNFASR